MGALAVAPLLILLLAQGSAASCPWGTVSTKGVCDCQTGWTPAQNGQCCSPNSHWVSGSGCACDSGTSWNGHTCAGHTPTNCPWGTTPDSSFNCVCRSGWWAASSGQCCSPNSFWKSGSGCTCNSGYTWNGNTCAGSAPSSGGGVAKYLSQSLFDSMFKLIADPSNNGPCTGKNLMTYQNLLTAAAAFPAFAASSDDNTNKRELAAFLGQASQETNGGSATPGGWFYLAGGLCFVVEGGGSTCPSNYCSPSSQYPCNPSASYCGRGPLQLSYNFNYGPAGQALGVDLLNNPQLVQSDGVLAWKSSLWFWMTAQSPIPSCHQAMTQQGSISGRPTGYGLCTNVVNGGVLQCGNGGPPSSAEQQKIDYYKKYCSLLGVDPGTTLACSNQAHF